MNKKIRKMLSIILTGAMLSSEISSFSSMAYSEDIEIREEQSEQNDENESDSVHDINGSNYQVTFSYELDDLLPETNEQLFETYANKVFSISDGEEELNWGTQKRSIDYSDIENNLYDQLIVFFADIADGKRESSQINISVNTIIDNIGFSAEDLEVESLVEAGDISEEVKVKMLEKLSFDYRRLMRGLLSECPYELYWFDKTKSSTVDTNLSFEVKDNRVYYGEESSMSFSFCVCADYAKDGLPGTMDLDTEKTGAACKAVVNAQNIVKQNADYNDIDKLAKYLTTICSLVSYDYNAYNNIRSGNVQYGDPWQLISVFDDDYETNVVCEGYAKAFQYLCDLSDFDEDILCYTVDGDMRNNNSSEGEAHMWNIIHMPDGKNYLSDPTSCDAYMIGSGYKLFMKEAEHCNVDGESSFVVEQNGAVARIYYTYSEDTIRLWENSGILEISTSKYENFQPDTVLEDFDYEYSNKGIIIKKYVGNSNKVIVPAEIEGKKVFGIDYYAFREDGKDGKGPEEIYFSEGIEALDYQCVESCTALKKAYIPSTARFCTMFMELNPDEWIPHVNAPFLNCRLLEDIEIGTDNPYMMRDQYGVLYSKDGKTIMRCPPALDMDEYKIQDGVELVGDGVFEHCDGLKKITCPDSVKTIGYEAFEFTRQLESIELGNGVKTIKNIAFGNSAIKSIYIPSQLEEIQENAFAYSAIEKIEIDPANKYFFIKEGVLFSRDLEDNSIINLLYYPKTKTEITYTVPEGVLKIEGSAFAEARNLQEVIVGEDVKSIRWSAFVGCNSLEYLFIPKSVEYVGSGAFSCQEIPDLNNPLRVVVFENKNCEIDDKDLPHRSAFGNTYEDTLICAEKGGLIEKYALEHDINFRDLSEIELYNSVEGVDWGDLDYDTDVKNAQVYFIRTIKIKEKSSDTESSTGVAIKLVPDSIEVINEDNNLKTIRVSLTYEGKKYVEEKVFYNHAGHTWKVEFEWTKIDINNSTANAIFTCEEDGAVINSECSMTSVYDDNIRVWEAYIIGPDEKYYSDLKTFNRKTGKEAVPEDHLWSEPSWIWDSTDLEKVTAKAEFSCSVMWTTIEAIMSREEKDGEVVWTAEVKSPDGIIYTDTKRFAQEIVPAYSISLNKNALVMRLNDEPVQLTATVEPAGPSDMKLAWVSSDIGVAKVSDTGIVSATGVGSAIITVSIIDTDYSTSCNVVVIREEDSTSVNRISLDKELLNLVVDGESVLLNAIIEPDYLIDADIVWSSSDINVAEVSNTGMVSPVGIGEAIITAAVYGTDKSASCKVIVGPATGNTISLNSIILDCSNLTLKPNDAPIQLHAIMEPKDVTDIKLIWATTDSSVATVSDNGIVSPVGPGNALITVTAEGYQISATCEVTVIPDHKATNPVIEIDDTVTELHLIKGQKFTLPETGWSSNNTKYLSVSKKGVLTAKKATPSVIKLTKDKKSIDVYITQPVMIKKKITLDAGEKRKIDFNYDSSHLWVTWYSNSPDIATISDDGEVEAIAKGTATITAYVNGTAYTCKVIVKENVAVSDRTLHMTLGSTKTIKIKGLKNPVWVSDNQDIVTINKNKITAKSLGETVIRTNVGGKEYRIKLYIEDPTLKADGLQQTGKYKYSIKLNSGDSKKIIFNKINQDVVFKSSKGEVAYYDVDGFIVANRTGKCKLTAKINGKTITINVRVN